MKVIYIIILLYIFGLKGGSGNVLHCHTSIRTYFIVLRSGTTKNLPTFFLINLFNPVLLTTQTITTRNQPCIFLNFFPDKLLLQASLTILAKSACVHRLPWCTFWTELWIVIHNPSSSKLVSKDIFTCQTISMFFFQHLGILVDFVPCFMPPCLIHN